LHPSAAREAIVLLAVAAFSAGISLRCVEPMLPQLAADFGTSVSAASIIITAFALAYAGAVLLQGPLGDRYGKLRVVTIGTALAGAAALGCAAAWDLGSLAAARFLMAMFASAPMALGIAYIGDVVPLADRQTTIARFVAGSIFGQTLGPLFGGVFTDWAGWRSSFFALGIVFLAAALVMFVRTRRDWPPLGPGRFAPAAIHADLLARRAVRWLVAVGMAETFLFFGAFFFLGAFFRARFGVSYTVIGLLLAGYGVGGLVYSSMVKWLTRRLRERSFVAAGGALGLLAFGLILLSPDWIYTIPCTICLGIAFYLLHNTVQTKASEVAPDARGSAVALYAAAWALGQALGAAAAGGLVAMAGYVPAIGAFAAGFALLGWWLRSNLWRLQP
jgi:MFS transporter, YNFM family, putative membrane transport protein